MYNRIKVLHIAVKDGFGGIETFLLETYRNIDRTKVEFDFVVCAPRISVGKGLEMLGGKLHYLPGENKILSYMRSLRSVMRGEEYDIIHIHKNSLANILPFLLIKKNLSTKILLHSHNTQPSHKAGYLKLLHKCNRWLVRNKTDGKLACSRSAAQWMFKKYGRDAVIINNGVNVERFRFQQEIRDRMREKYNLEDNLVIGNVGRFVPQKNHELLLDIFQEICKQRENTILLLCGTGQLREAIKEKARYLQLYEKILFLDNQPEIENFYQAMDLFLLPSSFEGLGIVGVEAQSMGLKCIISDKVPEEIIITDLVERVKLDATPQEWARVCLTQQGNIQREKYSCLVGETDYNVKNSAEKLLRFYIGILEGG